MHDSNLLNSNFQIPNLPIVSHQSEWTILEQTQLQIKILEVNGAKEETHKSKA